MLNATVFTAEALTLLAQNPGQAETQAAARASAEIAREQAAVTREQAQAAREQARVQTEQFKENLKEQIKASIQAAREAEQGFPVAPVPPVPPFPPEWSTGEGTPHRGGDIPPQAVDMVAIIGMTLVFCVVGLPIAKAFARWLDRRGTPATVTPEMTNRLHSIEQAVESIAVEVERISEGQRFTTRVLSERTHEPVGDFHAREPLHVGLPADSGPGAPVNARRS